VFGGLILMYGFAGQLLYGADLSEFSDIPSATQACFALMLGQGDFARMREITETGTLVFYWSWVPTPRTTLTHPLAKQAYCWGK